MIFMAAWLTTPYTSVFSMKDVDMSSLLLPVWGPVGSLQSPHSSLSVYTNEWKFTMHRYSERWKLPVQLFWRVIHQMASLWNVNRICMLPENLRTVWMTIQCHDFGLSSIQRAPRPICIDCAVTKANRPRVLSDKITQLRITMPRRMSWIETTRLEILW